MLCMGIWCLLSHLSSSSLLLLCGVRFLNFEVGERVIRHRSTGFVRIYPRSAGTFTEVCEGVSGFLAKAAELPDADDDTAAQDA